jgi:starch phosphorylase
VPDIPATPSAIDEFLSEPRVAYFSMEIALESGIPTYAGGLGVLAGDTLRSSADLGLPLVGVTLVSRMGYFRQVIDATGRQVEQPQPWDPARTLEPLDAKIAVRIGLRLVWVGAWLYVLGSQMGGRAPVVLLDTDLPENGPEDREITHFLYGGDDAYRLKQEIVLGMGGVRMLHALGFEVREYHMNEGHSALLGLELLRRYTYPAADVRPGEAVYDLPRVRELCRFTTHTPVEAGHDRFDYALVDRVLEFNGDRKVLRDLAGNDALNMTRLALNLSQFVNGVARSHAELSQRMFPGYRVRAITNGVHPFTWTAAPFRTLYDRHVPGWCHEPELLSRAELIPASALAAAHAQAKRALLESIQRRTGIALRPDVATLGFARRMTAYKRPDLLFTDLERLKAVARTHALQIVLAGKAHPRDLEGKRLIERLHAHVRALAGEITVVYLADYDMALAQELVAGVDVWLNTPQPPLEASGTSGMKAAFNGVPSLSVPDGWWLEGCIEGVTGWSVEDAASLYRKLEEAVLPAFYEEGGARWVELMRGVIRTNAAFFNSHRMMRRYATEAYLR